MHCKVPDVIDHLITHCHSEGGFYDEDNHDYDVFWRTLPPDYLQNNASSLQSGFRYTSAKEADAVPVMGKFYYFSGGGYIVDVPRDAEEAQELLADLEENAWINHDTKGNARRLCMREFSVSGK